MPAPITHAFIGLGSNLEDPLQQVQTAVDEINNLDNCQVISTSPWYSSKAIGPGEQPDYINGVIEVTTSLPPLELLRQLQSIEQAHDRKRLERWGPRTLDLDILLYDNYTSQDETLTVPHPRLIERNFVLLPLFDIAPTLSLPNGHNLKDLVQNCSKDGITPLTSA